MSHPDKNVSDFYAKVERYGGWQQVPAERIHSIFSEVVKPAEMGFVLAKRGYLARQINTDIFHVIKLDALKGGAYGLSYGLSLSYVPYPYLPKLKWHRTLKSVSLDLREQPQVHWSDPAQAAIKPGIYIATSMLGEKCFAEELETVWKLCSSKISVWFDSTRDFPAVIAKCDQHLQKRQSGVRYLPGARLVRALTCARIGRTEEAGRELETFLSEYQEGVEARANLHVALDQANSQWLKNCGTLA